MFRRFFKWSGLLVLAALLLPFGSPYAQDSASSALRRAQEYREQRDYPTALHYYRRSLDHNPSYTEALTGAGEVSLLLDDLERADDYFSRLLRLNERSLPAHIGLGRIATRRGQREEALRLLRRALELSPGNLEATNALGDYYQRVGRNDLASGYYQRVLRQSPNHLPTLLSLARIAAGERRFSEAERHLSRARQAAPASADYYATEGEIALMHAANSTGRERRQRIDEADRAYRLALEVEPENPRIEREFVQLDLWRNRYEAAIERLERLLGRFESDAKIHYQHGTAWRLHDEDGPGLERALRSLQRSIELDPADSLARFSLEELIAIHSRRVGQSSPVRGQAVAHHRQMMSYWRSRNRLDLYRVHLQRALILSPQSTPLLEEQLEIYRREGDYENFIRNLQILRQRNPDNQRLQFRLDQALRERNRALPYRETLFSPGVDPTAATFRRTPTEIFLFDLAPSSLFTSHPDGGERISSALRYHLHLSGRVAPVDERYRSEVMRLISLSGQGELSTGYGSAAGRSYRPEYLRFLQDAVRAGQKRPDYIIAGSYHFSSPHLEFHLQLIDSATGRVIEQMRLGASGRDALHETAARAARNLATLIPLRGELIKVKSDSIFINLGRRDGVEVGAEFEVSQAGRSSGRIRVVETSTWFSRAEAAEGQSWRLFAVGDRLSELSD